MSDSPRDRTDEDLAALLEELDATLASLREELTDGEAGDRRRGRGLPRPPGAPRPPSPGDLLRFTTDYTIPTVVATLEATIEALELVRGVLELAAPGESRDRRRRRRRGRLDGRRLIRDAVTEGATAAGDRALGDATAALARLRETLSEADLPEDEASRDLIEDARELSAELERRVTASRETVERERRRERAGERDPEPGHGDGTDGGPVTIEVGGDDEHADSADGADDETDESEERNPEVDVDAELESIKRQLGKTDDAVDDASDVRVEEDDENANANGS